MVANEDADERRNIQYRTYEITSPPGDLGRFRNFREMGHYFHRNPAYPYGGFLTLIYQRVGALFAEMIVKAGRRFPILLPSKGACRRIPTCEMRRRADIRKRIGK
jgi:hypothetical protein